MRNVRPGFFGGRAGGGVSNPFPTIAGLTLRLESDLGVTDASGNVTDWVDQAQGIAFTATGGGTARPTKQADQIGTIPAIRFNGSSNLMDSESLVSDILTGANPSTFKVIAVLKNNSAVAHAAASYDEPAVFCDAGSFFSPVSGDSTRIDSGFFAGPDALVSILQSKGSLIYVESTLTAAAGGTLALQIGFTGVPATTTGVGTVGGVSGFLKLGRNYANAAFWQGDLFALYVATSMSAPELAALQVYLRAKYGVG